MLQVQPHAVRTEWMVREPANRIREVPDGLYVPLAEPEVSPAYVPSNNGRRNSTYGFGARLPLGRWIGHGPDRCTSLQGMRSHHDPERVMLPLRELRQHERVFVIMSPGYGLVVGSGMRNLKSQILKCSRPRGWQSAWSEKPSDRIQGIQ